MDKIFNYYKSIKKYIYNLFYYDEIFSEKELMIINKNNNLKLKYEQLNVDEIYKELTLISNNLNKNTPIIQILQFIDNELVITKTNFELNPSSINSKNIIHNTLLKYLKDKFETLLYIKKSVNYKND